MAAASASIGFIGIAATPRARRRRTAGDPVGVSSGAVSSDGREQGPRARRSEEPSMCYQPTARPPLPPIAGGSGLAGSEEIVLEAADGNRFSAFSTRTDEPGAPAVVILPDNRGLHPFYRDLAIRFAEAGADATAMDYFGRTAGTGER